MGERQAIPKKLRFDVFKRDGFKCQYCGAAAPEVVLHCDHVNPVASGGRTELLNLIAACSTCNLGKGARKLDDGSAVEKQRRQIEELNERRQQLEMMLEWRDEIAKHSVDEVQAVCDAIDARSSFGPNDHGKISVRRWVKKYGLAEVLASVDEAYDRYMVNDSHTASENAFKKIGSVLSIRQQEKIDPHIRKMLYVQAILRNRWDMPNLSAVDPLRQRIAAGHDIAAIEAAAKNIREDQGWSDLDASTRLIMSQAATAVVDEPEEDAEDPPEIRESLAAWDDPEFHISMLADCFPGDAGRILKSLAGWTSGQFGGAIKGGSIAKGNMPALRGMRAVGLIEPIYQNKDIVIVHDDGRIEPTFSIPVLSPREATQAFNRLGSLRLSFWSRPAAFARVDEVH